MIRFAELYPDVRIVQTLSGKLSWSHFAEMMKIDDPLQTDFFGGTKMFLVTGI